MVLSLLLVASLAATPDKAPALTCIAATVRADGRISDRRVEVSSGDKAADRRAIDYLGKFNLRNLPSLKVAPHSGYVLIAEPRDGAFELQLTEARTFHASCEAALAMRNAGQ